MNMTAPAQPRTKGRWGKRLGRMALACVAAVAALELFLRVVDPWHYGVLEAREDFSAQILMRGRDGVLRSKPGSRGEYLGTVVVIGAHGLRNPEVAVPKPADVFRILVLGDSLPFGWGVAEADAFPRVLERELAARPRADGKRYEVVNAGTPGFGLVEEYLWLRDHGLAMAPDVVLHVVIHNDVEPLPAAPRLLLSPGLRRVRALRLLERVVEIATQDGTHHPGTGVTPEQFVFTLDKMVELCAGSSRYVLFDTVGVPAAIAACAAKAIPRIAAVVDHAWLNAHHVHAADFHPNAAGHRWFVDRILAQLDALVGG
jgi:lysophospholipase L1-like esterase